MRLDMNNFTDPGAAVEEAEFLAKEHGVAYAIVGLSSELLRVLPLWNARGMNILEICRP